MEQNEDVIIEGLNKEMRKVTTLLDFLIIQPHLIDSLIGNEREKIMVQNLLRVKCCKLWSDNMVKEVESKCSEESLKAINELFEMVEVNKREPKRLSNNFKENEGVKT